MESASRAVASSSTLNVVGPSKAGSLSVLAEDSEVADTPKPCPLGLRDLAVLAHLTVASVGVAVGFDERAVASEVASIAVLEAAGSVGRAVIVALVRRMASMVLRLTRQVGQALVAAIEVIEVTEATEATEAATVVDPIAETSQAVGMIVVEAAHLKTDPAAAAAATVAATAQVPAAMQSPSAPDRMVGIATETTVAEMMTPANDHSRAALVTKNTERSADTNETMLVSWWVSSAIILSLISRLYVFFFPLRLRG